MDDRRANNFERTYAGKTQPAIWPYAVGACAAGLVLLIALSFG